MGKGNVGQKLDVFLGGRHVGSIESRGPKRYRFTYSDEVLETSAEGEVVLSASLPVQAEGFTPGQSAPFFEGLLPEGVVRETIARKLQISEDNSFALLEELGADVAGAVVVLPGGQAPVPPGSGQIKWLDDAELAQRVADLPSSPLGITVDSDEGPRLSLGGLQGKLVLTRSPSGKFGLPLHGAPSTHILKPGNDEKYPDIVANEAFCLRVARCAKLPAAAAEIIEPTGVPWLLVERFDRIFDQHSQIIRIHQEDICQARGLREKYEAYGGPSFADTVELLRLVSVQEARDVITLVQATAMNILLGNSDAHGKNFALLYDEADGSARLAPLYDIVSTNVYGLEPKLAMPVGGIELPDQVNAEAWRGLAREAGLGAAVISQVAEITERVVHCARATREVAQAEGWHRSVIDEVVSLVEARAAAITS